MVKLEPTETIQFLRTKEIDGMMTLEVVDSGSQETQFGERPYLDVRLPNKELRRFFLNKNNIKRLIDVGINDTKDLHGEKIVVYKTAIEWNDGTMKKMIGILKVSIQGKLKEVGEK